MVSNKNSEHNKTEFAQLTRETLLKATRLALVASVHVHMTAAVQFAAVVELSADAALEEATERKKEKE